MECKDRHDSIFAFLDLATRDGPRLSLDYHQDPRAGFRDFAAQYLRTVGDVTLLECIAYGHKIVRNDLPTWAPNWNFLDTSHHCEDVLDRNATSPPMPAHGTFRKPEVICEELLKVHGATFDTVEKLTDIFQPSTTTPQAVSDLWCQTREHPSLTALPKDFLVEFFVSILTNGGRGLSTEDLGLGRKAYINELCNPATAAGSSDWNEHRKDTDRMNVLHRVLQRAIRGKKFMITEGGSIGLAPSVECDGDLCAMILGCVYPCLLSASQSDSTYQFKGSAQVYYFSFTCEEAHSRSSPGLDKEDDIVWWHELVQYHDQARMRCNVEEQDIYLH